MAEDDWLTVPKVAERVGVSTATVYNHRADIGLITPAPEDPTVRPRGIHRAERVTFEL